MTDTDSNYAVLLCADLFFTSKVTGTAGQLGFRVETALTADAALHSVATGCCRCILVDLELPQLNLVELMHGLTSENRPEVIAFGPHVRTDLLEKARQAGCDQVLPRSRFSSTFPEFLQKNLGE